MTPDTIVAKYKSQEISQSEAMNLIGQEMENARKASRSYSYLNRYVDIILGAPSEPDPEDKALATLWERSRKRHA